MSRGRRDHKKQHFVPQCYTKAWCDPSAPVGPRSSPYVWVFNKDDPIPRRKAPSNLFTETDIYTIYGLDGRRDLRLEHRFQELEDKFTRMRNLTFNKMKWPDAEQLTSLFVFVATAQARTQASRDFHRRQWGGIRKRMEEMRTAYEEASPVKKMAFETMVLPSSAQSDMEMTIDDVRAMEDHPIQFMIAEVVNTVTRIFARMHVAVLCTHDPIGFVTTDQPCTWYDPESYKLPPLYRGAGLARKTIEVTLPISSRQCLVITHDPDLRGFVDVNSKIVDDLNYRHISYSSEHFISCRQEIRPAWFSSRSMPDDSWESRRDQKLVP